MTDGLGGDGLGEQAAQLALQVLDRQRAADRPGSRFEFVSFARDLVDQANRAIGQFFQDYQGFRIGTAFSLLVIEQETAYTLGLGNCPIYLYRDRKVHRLTRDHISDQPEQGRLSRYLGIPNQPGLNDADNLTRTLLEKGDVLLLMTDGLTRYLSPDQIEHVLSLPLAFVQQIRQLRDQALEQGGEDNLAVIGVKVLDPRAASVSDPPRSKAKKQRPQSPGVSGRRQQQPPARWQLWLKPLLFYLFFVLLGFLASALIFSLPGWLRLLSAG